MMDASGGHIRYWGIHCVKSFVQIHLLVTKKCSFLRACKSCYKFSNHTVGHYLQLTLNLFLSKKMKSCFATIKDSITFIKSSDKLIERLLGVYKNKKISSINEHSPF
jgi:hypothetical protein